MLDPKFETLLQVDKYHNYTKAAQALNLTQPAVTQHIKQLEKELKIKIFNRSKRDLIITPEGVILIKYARRIKALYQQLDNAISDQKRQTKSLIIGITHTAESNKVTEAIARYCSLNPGIRIKIITEDITKLYDKLNTYEIDLAITEGGRISRKYKMIPLDTDSLVVVLSPTHRLSKQLSVTFEDIKKEPMIFRLPTSGTRNLFVNELKNKNYSISDLNVILEVDNIATIKDLVERQIGVSILPRSVCFEEVKKNQLKVLPLEGFSLIRETNVVFLDDFDYIKVVNEIIKTYNEMNLR
ncbi:MAG: LysR family transcriptional regulator [Erysipelotrichia bacterium]|jgi:DNA-binding transcriptional LysR family regulator|nr:LysR family transcriptional regulator [Erysipelotrichia bacterium]